MSSESQNELPPSQQNISRQRWLISAHFVVDKLKTRLSQKFSANTAADSAPSVAVQSALLEHGETLQLLENERQSLVTQADLLGNKLLPVILLSAAAFASWSALKQLWALLSNGDFALSSLIMSVLSPFFWGIILTIIVSYYRFSGPYLNYIDNCKRRLIPILLKQFGQLNYQRYGSIPLQDLSASGILPQHDVAYQEDYIDGHYPKGYFQLSHAEFYCQQAKQKRQPKRFHGLMLCLAAPIGFEGVTTTVQQKTLTSRFGLTSKSVQGEQVFLEDATFNQRFNVCSTDQIAARVWLTPALMQRLLNLSDQYAHADVTLSLFNQKILLLLNTQQDLLTTPDVETAVTDLPFFGQLQTELTNIFGILDLLQNDRAAHFVKTNSAEAFNGSKANL